MTAIVCKIGILLCLAVAVSEASMIKVHLVKEHGAHVLLKRQTNPCTDAMLVNRSDISLPGDLSQLNDRVRFYRSDAVRDSLNAFQDTQVPLVNYPRTVNLREVLEILQNNSCIPVIYGGAVRDQFLNKNVDDADIALDCSLHSFYNVCVSAWGEANCGIRPDASRPVGNIGVTNSQLKDVDIVAGDIFLFASLNRLEYTANSLAFGTNGLNVLMDVAETGLRDVCDKVIRIPSDDDSQASWDRWLATYSAILRFWKLRAEGFTAYNETMLNFITSNAMARLQNDPNMFGNFYCDEVYDVDYLPDQRRCDASNEVCTSNQGRAERYNTAFADDFDSYWTNEIEPNLLPACGGCALVYGVGVHVMLPFVLFGLLFSA